jgi:hypothetical protein
MPLMKIFALHSDKHTKSIQAVCGPNTEVSSGYVHKKKLRGLSPQANYTDRATAAVGEVVPTFAGRGCYVVRAADSHGR